MMKKGYEREVALYCLQQIGFRSVKAAVEYLQRTNSKGLRCHKFVEDVHD